MKLPQATRSVHLTFSLFNLNLFLILIQLIHNNLTGNFRLSYFLNTGSSEKCLNSNDRNQFSTMRYKYYSILYLVIILLYLFRPLLPYIDYMINRDYITKNLCVEKDNPDNTCHGKCHLQEQLNKSSVPVNNEGNDKENKISDNNMKDHLRPFSDDLLMFPDGSPMAGHYFLRETTSNISDIFVPPQE